MDIGSIRWLAPRKHRRLLISAIALVALSLPLLGVLPFRSQNVLARGFAYSALFVWAWTWIFAMVLGFPVLFLQTLPWRRESFFFRSYQAFLFLLGATELVLINMESDAALRILVGSLFAAALFIPRAFVLWTVPDVAGSWDLGANPKRFSADASTSPPAAPPAS